MAACKVRFACTSVTITDRSSDHQHHALVVLTGQANGAAGKWRNLSVQIPHDEVIDFLEGLDLCSDMPITYIKASSTIETTLALLDLDS